MSTSRRRGAFKVRPVAADVPSNGASWWMNGRTTQGWCSSFSECDRRTYVVAIVFLAAPGSILVYASDDPVADRVARLVKQLGHNEFAKREAASKELDAIGEPALGALRKATK